MKFKFKVSAIVALAVASAFAANTWYVDAEKGVDAAGRGTSAGNAFLTLQYAHDQASAGDTIIAAPGNYDKGYGLASGHAHTNRLCVSKELHFVSATPKAAHIVGAFDPATGADGANALRCVCVTHTGYGTSFADFTFRNGATNPAGSGSGNGDWAGKEGSSIANGGGLLVFGARTISKDAAIYKVYLTDCVISNCVSKWGAAIHGGTAIRCFFAHNTGTSFGQAVAGAALWNTVIYDTVNRDARPIVGNHCTIVNCTIVGGAYGHGRYGKAFNTIFSELANPDLFSDSYTPTHVNCLGKNECAHPLANPFFGDWRVISEVAGAETGLMSDLTDQILLPPGTAMTDFNGRPIDTSKATCTIGAVQELAANASGTLAVPAGTMVDGVRASRQMFLRAVGEYPRLFALRPGGSKFFRYRRSDSYGGATFNYLDYEGKSVFAPPPYPGQNYSVSEETYGPVYWCSPEADAAAADGTEQHPYRTIQAAVDAGKAQYDIDEKSFIVNCLPGVYAEGGGDGEGHHNRVVVPNKCPCLIRATAGAAATTIKGAADPNPPMPDTYIGCGPDAMRCVLMLGDAEGQCAIQGFTLADGHSSYTDHNVDNHSDRVGGVYGKASRTNSQILDCVFTNCTAVRGGAVYYGVTRRCQFYDCISYGGVMRYGTLVSSYVDPTCVLGKGGTGASQNRVVGTEMCALNVTQPGDTEFGGTWNYCSLWGRIYCSSKPQYGTVYTPQWNGVSSLGSGGAAQGEVFWADEAMHGVGAVYSASPALHAVQYPQRGTPEWGAFASNLCAFADSDLNGVVQQLKNGRLVPGANVAAVDSVHVPPNAGIAVAGATPNAEGIIEVASSDFAITVSAAATGTRPCVGFTANGVTNLFPLAAPYTITHADVMAEGGIDLAGIFAPHWYVNADPAIGNDANSGFTPDVPKRTLAAAMSAPGLASGDTVHAAAGVYDEGSMEWEKNGATVFRVAVKGGVTLVGDEGADKTFIVGAPDTTDSANPDNPGYGPNAMHCVYLNALATIRGFTVTGGYTDVYDDERYSSDWVVPVTGGGVCGNSYGRDNAYMYDCIVSNNYAYTGGGTRWVNAINCRITDNHATYDGGNARESNLWGCYLNRGYQGVKNSASSCFNFTRNAYCTFGPDNWQYDGVTPNLAINGASSGIASISNCVVLGSSGGAGAMTIAAYNTVFAKGKGSFKIDDGSCVVATDGMPGQFDAEGRPLPGCPAVDRGDRDNLPTLLGGIDHDASGFQRIMNGEIDVGGLEGDWRVRYASDCATTRKFGVTAASPEVKEEAGVVTLHPGDTLAAQFENPQQRSTPCAVTVRLTGAGTLSVKLNGAVLQEVTAAGETTLRFANTLALNALDFAYTGEGTAALVSAERMVGKHVIIR